MKRDEVYATAWVVLAIEVIGFLAGIFTGNDLGMVSVGVIMLLTVFLSTSQLGRSFVLSSWSDAWIALAASATAFVSVGSGQRLEWALIAGLTAWLIRIGHRRLEGGHRASLSSTTGAHSRFP